MFGNVQLAAAASNLSSGFLTKSMKHNSPRLNIFLIAQQLKGSDRRSLPRRDITPQRCPLARSPWLTANYRTKKLADTQRLCRSI